MDPTLQEQLDRLTELTDDELAALESSLVAEFDRLDGEARTPENVQIMADITAAHDNVVQAQTERVEAAAAAEQQAEELRQKMHPVGEDDKKGEDKPEDKPADKPEVKDEKKDDKPAADQPESIAAGAGSAGRPDAGAFNSAQGSGPAPKPTGLRAESRVIAMAHGSNGRQAGEQITDRKELVELMAQRINALGRGTGEKLLVASARLEYPEERKLTGDPVRDSEKIAAVVSPQAIVASGGICNPVEADYSLMVMSSDDEPIGNALPTFGADRGGLRFIAPPTFASVGASGTAVWTEATDANPGTATKPVQTIVCGNEVEVFVDAIPTRLKFGNMMARFSPEIVEANTELALANAARVRELYRLSKISAQSTIVSSGQLLGAARDLLATVDLAVAAYCYRSRINRDQIPVHVLMPDWAKDMIRADFARTYAADPSDVLAVTDAEIESYFTARRTNITWFLDGQTAVTGGGVNSAFQGFGAQGNNAALLDWPRNLVWWMFAEGSFQRLDGGRLDIGVVRDSVLDSTNDYETFMESFEGIAFRGFESLQVVSAVRPNGAYAGPVQTAASPAIY